jgi:predicted RNase H-like HicB family nuclease
MGETIKLDATLTAYVRRDGRRRWIAVCPSIDVASQGSSEDEAKRCLKEAVEVWFESCVERGVLDQALREASFRPSAYGPASVKREEPRDEDVRGEAFAIHITIPAYQASAVLGKSA